METECFVALDVRTSASRDLLGSEENGKGRFEMYGVLLLYVSRHFSSI